MSGFVCRWCNNAFYSELYFQNIIFHVKLGHGRKMCQTSKMYHFTQIEKLNLHSIRF